jgi:hypothetical protein
MTEVSPPDWVRRYEDLRAHTLGSLATLQGQAWGLAVFVQRGMRSWMQAWQAPPPLAGDPAASPRLAPLSLNRAPEATVLLTNMTLRCLGLAL